MLAAEKRDYEASNFVCQALLKFYLFAERRLPKHQINTPQNTICQTASHTSVSCKGRNINQVLFRCQATLLCAAFAVRLFLQPAVFF